MPFAPGMRLGPYEISPLGQGGMGEVYRARDPRLNRDVAIKTSREEFNERFDREARADGVVKVIDFGLARLDIPGTGEREAKE